MAGARDRTLPGGPVHLPGAKRIDARLVPGGPAYGTGWGLVGYWPGPALAALAVGGMPTSIFVAAMVAGMALCDVFERIRSAHAAGLPPPAARPGE